MSYDIVTNDFRKMIYSKFPVQLTKEEENRIDDLCEDLYLICIDSHTSKAKKENALLHLISIIMPYFAGLISKYSVNAVVDQEDLDMVVATTIYKIISNKSFDTKNGSSFLYYLSCSLQRELKKEYKVGLPLHCSGRLTAKTKAEIISFQNKEEKKYYSFSEYEDKGLTDPLYLRVLNKMKTLGVSANDLHSDYWLTEEMNNTLRKCLFQLGKEGEVLYLYFGLDRGYKRTIREVSEMLNLSKKQTETSLNKGKQKFKQLYPSFYDDYAA